MISININNKKPVCAICGKLIEPEIAFIYVNGTIVIDSKTTFKPNIFQNYYQQFNYSQGFYSHDTCWIKMLEKLGVELYDINTGKLRNKLEE